MLESLRSLAQVIGEWIDRGRAEYFVKRIVSVKEDANDGRICLS